MRIVNTTAIGLLTALVMAFATPALAEDTTMTPLDIPMIGDMEALQPGEDAPSFTVKDLEGKDYSFVGASPGAKLMVFWSIFCEPCRAEMPLIQSLYDSHKEQGLEVIAVALDGDLANNIRQFAKQGKYTFTILLDQESEDGSLVVAEDYVVPGTPTIYIIDKNGKITFSKVGRVGETELEKAIQSALGK